MSSRSGGTDRAPAATLTTTNGTADRITVTIGAVSANPNHMVHSSAQITAGIASPTRLTSPNRLSNMREEPIAMPRATPTMIDSAIPIAKRCMLIAKL